jgi:hypothetical protein
VIALMIGKVLPPRPATGEASKPVDPPPTDPGLNPALSPA